jgi:hypothetical protein
MTSHNYLIEAVSALDDGRLFVTFTNNDAKIYDVNKLVVKIPAFAKLLANIDLFRKARPEVNGLAVVWDDYFDLASDEVYLNGTEISSTKAA